jgi:hypothetical protein
LTGPLLVLVAVACASAEQHHNQTPGPGGAPYDLKTPSIVAVSPGQVQVGDVVRVLGHDFVDSSHGNVRAHFSGTYSDEVGNQDNFDADIPLTYANPGRAEFVFGPSVMFSRAGDKIGTFRGQVVVINRLTAQGTGGPEKASMPFDVRIDVMPSLLIPRFHSADASCQGVSDATTADNNLTLEARAIGMGEATQDDPITFTVHILSPAITAQYARSDFYGMWPVMPEALGTSPDGVSSFSIAITGGTTLLVDPRNQSMVVNVDPPSAISQRTYDQVRLYRLFTGELMGNGPSVATLIIDAVRDSATARRQLVLQVYSDGEIQPYDGNNRVAERYAAQLVSGCFSGGDIGRDLQYTEGQSESRQRSVSYRWDINTGVSLGLTLGTTLRLSAGAIVNFALDGSAQASANASWSQTFGVDVSESVSSEHHTGENISAHILPGFYGACWRQTERVEKKVGIIFHSPCGPSAEVGKAVLTDWNWGFDIAHGPQSDGCPPPTTLPPAQMFPDPDGGG